MKKFQKKFDFYATNVEIDEYIFSILKGSEVDPDDEIEVYMDRNIDNVYATIKVLHRVLH